MLKRNAHNFLLAVLSLIFFGLHSQLLAFQPRDILIEALYYDREIKLLYEDLLNFLYESESEGKGIDSLAVGPEFLAYEATISKTCEKAIVLLDKARQLRLNAAVLDSLSTTVARAFAFQALAMVEAEKFGLMHFLEYAVRNYFAALAQINDDKIPILYQILPEDIKVGKRSYRYLADLLDDRAQSLKQYSRVTFEFDSNDRSLFHIFPDLRLLQLDSLKSHLPFSAAQKKFSQDYAFATGASITVFLPAGSFMLYSPARGYQTQSSFANFLIPAGQQLTIKISYLANSLLAYERPRAQKISTESVEFLSKIKMPSLESYAKRSFPEEGPKASILSPTDTLQITNSSPGPSNVLPALGTVDSAVIKNKLKDLGVSSRTMANVLQICLLRGLLSFGTDYFGVKGAATMQEKVLNIVTSSLLKEISSGLFYESYSFWAVAWRVAKSAVSLFGPEARIIMELCEFVYCMIKNYVLVSP